MATLSHLRVPDWGILFQYQLDTSLPWCTQCLKSITLYHQRRSILSLKTCSCIKAACLGMLHLFIHSQPGDEGMLKMWQGKGTREESKESSIHCSGTHPLWVSWSVNNDSLIQASIEQVFCMSANDNIFRQWILRNLTYRMLFFGQFVSWLALPWSYPRQAEGEKINT